MKHVIYLLGSEGWCDIRLKHTYTWVHRVQQREYSRYYYNGYV